MALSVRVLAGEIIDRKDQRGGTENTAINRFKTNNNGVDKMAKEMDEFGKRLRKFREIKKLSQAEIEKRTGLKREYISKMENGDLKNPTYNTLIRLAAGLEVRVSELVDPAEFMKPREEPVIDVSGKNGAGAISKWNFVSVPIIETALAITNPGYIEEKDIQSYALVPASFLEETENDNRYRCVWVKGGSAFICIDSEKRDPMDVCGSFVAMSYKEKCVIRRISLDDSVSNIIGVPLRQSNDRTIVAPLKKNHPILGVIVYQGSNPNC